MQWPVRVTWVIRLLPERVRPLLPGWAPVDEEELRILSLFRNRAELKKSFSSAVEEALRLKDRVKQQEGATARVQEMLQELEARLSQPATAWPTLVFYQLRELWVQGRAHTQQFITELEGQQAERERRQVFAEFNRRQFERRQGVEGRCLDATASLAQARSTAERLERKLQSQQRFWHYFQRRRTRQLLQDASMRRLLAEQALEEAQAARDAFEAEHIEFTGISVEARRAINLAGLGYAQLLRERLEASGLFEAVKHASERREPPDDQYGDRAGCERMLAQIAAARVQFDKRDGLLPDIRKRADAFRALARYRAAGDVLPVPESIAAGGPVTTRVLSDDTWEIGRVLLP
jgi:hypothetical protein